jgi:hypothetical protein
MPSLDCTFPFSLFLFAQFLEMFLPSPILNAVQKLNHEQAVEMSGLTEFRRQFVKEERKREREREREREKELAAKVAPTSAQYFKFATMPCIQRERKRERGEGGVGVKKKE